MSTMVVVNTLTHSITFVTEKLLWSMKRIIIFAGLDTSDLISSWYLLEKGISTWLKSKDLRGATIEVFKKSDDSLITRIDFRIDYSYGSGDDGDFWVDVEPLKHAITKCGTLPQNCKYDVILLTEKHAPDVEGFVDTNFRSTEGFTCHSVGTTIGTNHIGTQLDYWRK